MTPAADTRGDYFDVFDVYLPVALAVFVIVCGFIALAVWRGRRRSAEPSRRRNNTALEGSYVVVLALVAAALLVLTLRVQDRMLSASASPRAVQIRVLAAKWHWRFEYPRYGIVQQGTDTRPAELVVPRDTPLDFRGGSLDVIHSFWIPQARFQRQLFNDRISTWHLQLDRDDEGGMAPCAFYCGIGHRTMRFRVTVLDPPAFRAWVARHR